MSTFAIPESEIRRTAQADGMTHLSTGVAIIRGAKILAVKRAAEDFLGGSYELPGGGVDPGETLEQSVKREVAEETGLTVSRIVRMFPGFEYSTPKKPRVRQVNFLVEVEAGDVTLSAEHDAYQWVNSDEVSKLPMSENMLHCFVAAFDALTLDRNETR